MKQFISYSDKQTKEFAKKLAKKNYQLIGLIGELGAGKTTFAQGYAEGLGVKDKIISPTFVLIRQHKIPNTKKILYHIDLYRLEDLREIKHLGIEEIMENPDNTVLIEWAEKIKGLLPKNTLKISFKVMDKNSRRIIFSFDPLI